RAVNDAGLAAVAREEVLELPLQRPSRQRAIQQVGPIERSDELDRLAKRELRRDVAPDARGRRRGERVETCGWKHLAEPRELAILRPEVVPPLADAMRFVNGDEAHAARRQAADKAVAPFAHQALRRDIEEAI